jgi:hypothetical protein
MKVTNQKCLCLIMITKLLNIEKLNESKIEMKYFVTIRKDIFKGL